MNPNAVQSGKDCGTTESQDSELRARSRRLSWFEKLARSRLHQRLRGIQGGLIRVSDLDQIVEHGQKSADLLEANWEVHSPKFFHHVATGGSLGVAESYLRGHWATDDLTELLRILCRNLDHLAPANSGIASLTKTIARAFHWLARNTKARSRQNIEAHYDLSNEFFELFLDPTLMYSSACFESPEMTLHDASVAKLEKICRKLDLRESENVLEIGTGWGGFALHAAGNVGCQLTTTTISEAQFEKAKARVHQAGLTDKVRLLTTDYRDLSGRFDKLVSIEMIEAVGEQFLDAYFVQCGRLLKPGGKFLLQGIVMPEERYESYRRSVDFIQKYIFPGGFLPSVAAIQQSVGRTSNLRMTSVEDLSTDYARTLQEWRTRFFDRIDQVRELGFDDRFIRMWEYYLCYCEAAFRENAVRVVQMVWEKPRF